ALPTSATAVAGLLRAQPRRRDHQPPDERRRGARPARHGRRQLARAEHVDAPGYGGAALLPRLASRAGLADGDAADDRRDRMVPKALGASVPHGAGYAR